MSVPDLLRGKREEILRIAAKHGAYNVRVFGSVARGDARANSDVDLLVDVGPNRTPFFPGGLIADLQDLLGRRVEVVTERGLHWYLRDRVLREAVPL
ncbi:MAG TPA: nucleotidyltransferase family protein [Terriglobia bacterium]|nr:nucleotidyltransferase family protein [Terriglobia bacterium]